MPTVALLLPILAFADVKQDLQANYAKIAQLIIGKNVRAVSGLLAPDFTEKETNGQAIPRMNLIAAWEAQSHYSKVSTWDDKVTDVTLSGGKAVAGVQAKHVIVLTLGAGKPSHTMEISMKRKDTWIKRGPTWLLQTSQVLQDSSTQDGKPTHRPRN